MGNSLGDTQQLQNRLCDFCLYDRAVTLSIEYYEKKSYEAAV